MPNPRRTNEHAVRLNRADRSRVQLNANVEGRPLTDSELRDLAKFLVGPAEIAQILDIEANTVNVWKVRHADFPTPVRRLISGDIWDVRDIRAWAASTGRRISVDDGSQSR